MVRLVRVGGMVAGYVWDYAGRMELLRNFWDAAVELDPEAAPLDEGRRFPLCEPGELERLWRGAGLVDVRSTGLEVSTPFKHFEDYWHPFLGGQGPAPAYVASLDARRQEALREAAPRALARRAQRTDKSARAGMGRARTARGLTGGYGRLDALRSSAARSFRLPEARPPAAA